MQPTLTQGELLIRPLREDDFDALWAISSDPLLWEQHPSKERATIEGFKIWFKEAVKALVIEWRGKIIGTSRYKPWGPGIVEIGWTFIARKHWGTGLNSKVKYLMLNHAFKNHDGVVFFVHEENYRSQKAVLKLGARRVDEINGIKVEKRPTAGAVFLLSKEDFQMEHYA